MIHKEAKKLFFLYISVFYLFPFLAGLILPDTFTVLYKGFNSLLGLAFISFFLFLVFIFEKIVPRKLSILSFKRLGGLFESKWFNIILAIIFFALSIRFSLKFGITFRQNGEATLNQTGLETIILFAIRTYAIANLLYLILKAVNDLPISTWQRIVIGITGLAFMFIISGSMDMLYILGYIVLAFKKEKVLFASLQKRKKSVYRRVIRSVLLIGLIVSIVFVGYADKFGTQGAGKLFSKTENVEQIVEHTVARVGIWYASIMAMGSHDVFDNTIALNTIDGISSNLNSRISVLSGTGNGIEQKRSSNWSAARVNYTQTYRMAENSRTGASPGLIASSFYLPFFPFNFIIISLYTMFILRRFSKAMRYSKKSFNFLGRFILLFFFATSLFADPVDYLNFVDPIFIYFILYLGVMDKIHSTSYSRFRKQLIIKQRSINSQYAA